MAAKLYEFPQPEKSEKINESREVVALRGGIAVAEDSLAKSKLALDAGKLSQEKAAELLHATAKFIREFDID